MVDFLKYYDKYIDQNQREDVVSAAKLAKKIMNGETTFERTKKIIFFKISNF